MAPTEGDPKTLRQLQETHNTPPPRRHDAPHTEAGEHSAVRNYVRDLVLGYNDGLVSVFAAVAGVVGAGFTPSATLKAGFAFGVAGAFSMGLGEYLSTKSQAEYYASEAAKEREHIRAYPDLESQEVGEILAKKGYPPAVTAQVRAHVMADEDRFVDFMMREEFGVGEEAGRTPWVATLFVMFAFATGALFPIVPFFFHGTARTDLLVAAVLSLVGLVVAGALKGKMSGISPTKSGAEMAAFGIATALITFGIGQLFGTAIS
ncbi:MAG: VIT1/CCC1 transporter family protein [Thermoplasmatota archaeon]